ncbi:MAG: DUF5118 domain-containing protein, partial [Cyclobacteriaceae bacterium]|nr:DUF5118 domain-containing protein [Cyclobacteriaceae bacterium]
MVVSVFGQKKKDQPQQQTSPSPAPAAATIDSKVAGMKKFPGFFEFYFDEKQDKIFLVIDKFNTEFLYVESLTA